MKYTCEKCDALAVWFYAPGDSHGVFCEEHIERGCSCNVIDWGIDDDSDDNQQRDDQGRILPCCEYDYDADGWEITPS